MDKEKRENKIKDLMETAMKDINTIIDVNTVIGKPFSINDGTTVIPVTKVTLGFMTECFRFVKVLMKAKISFFWMLTTSLFRI